MDLIQRRVLAQIRCASFTYLRSYVRGVLKVVV